METFLGKGILENYSLDFFICPSGKSPYHNYRASSKGQHVFEAFATENWGIKMGAVSILSFLSPMGYRKHMEK